jgi:hypothetical protein
MSRKRVALSITCHNCGKSLYAGFAHCQTASCRALRKEFAGYEKVVVKKRGACALSGAPTDVRLPNGDYIWAEDFLNMIHKGEITAELIYSEEFCKRFPQLCRGKK